MYFPAKLQSKIWFKIHNKITWRCSKSQ